MGEVLHGSEREREGGAWALGVGAGSWRHRLFAGVWLPSREAYGLVGGGRVVVGPRLGSIRAPFSFLYFKKKIKFQKYMFVLKNFKNTPRSPYGGRQDPVAQATYDRTLM